MLIGITGTDGSGKNTVVDYLVEKKGFTHYSARALFAEELARAKREETRANLRLIANELRTAHGNDFLINTYLRKRDEEGVKDVVIESIRALDEAKTLKENGGILLAVGADPKIRYERVIKRNSSSDHISFEEFCAHEELESNDPEPHGMQKRRVIEMADYTIMNNGSIENLRLLTEKFWSTIHT